jgi:hypothetical protein
MAVVVQNENANGTDIDPPAASLPIALPVVESVRCQTIKLIGQSVKYCHFTGQHVKSESTFACSHAPELRIECLLAVL